MVVVTVYVPSLLHTTFVSLNVAQHCGSSTHSCTVQQPRLRVISVTLKQILSPACPPVMMTCRFTCCVLPSTPPGSAGVCGVIV
jgi:hypothetical protein